VHVGYDRSQFTPAVGAKTTVDQFKATYQYNLSKRTALYSTASWLSNNDATRLTLPGASGAVSSGGDSSGIEFGIRHFF
jgi:predicted porin